MTENDKYYRTIDTGGYSPCILGNDQIIPRGEPRNVLPNCVGYVVARFNEFGSYGYCKYLGNTDAKYLIDLARSQGLEIGMTPKVGACIVWSDGDGEDKHGHAAIVEQILDPYAVLVSESGWDASVYTWSCSHYLGNDGQWLSGNQDEPNNDLGWLNQSNGYRFLGFIYNPALEIDKTLPNPVEENKQVDQLKVNCNDTMRVRLGHNLDSEIIGFAKEGLYNILQKCDDVDYTWCEVEKNKWIAIMPPYCEYIPKMQEIPNEEYEIVEDWDNDDFELEQQWRKEDEELAIDIINSDKESVILYILEKICNLIRKITEIIFRKEKEK